MPRAALAALLGLAVVLTACGTTTNERDSARASRAPRTSAPSTEAPAASSTDTPTDAPSAAPTDAPTPEGCPADLVESDPANGAEHVPDGTTVEYDTNPPVAGPHAGSTAETGRIYGASEAPAVEQLVHNMEHGAVIFWTNDLSREERALAEETVNEIYVMGYTSLIMLEYNEMEHPFAMTAWGVLQECVAMDQTTAQLMHAFTESFYGSGAEGILACTGQAAELPACQR